MFHESGEESLEHGAGGCGCSWFRRMQDLECGPAPSPHPTFQVAGIFRLPHSTSHTGHFQQGAEA